MKPDKEISPPPIFLSHSCWAPSHCSGSGSAITSDGVLAMEGWAAADPQGAAEWLKTEQPDLPIWIAAWAATLLPSPSGTPLDQTPIFHAASRWGESDPARARAWLDANAHQPWAETARAGYTRSAPETGDDLCAEKKPAHLARI